MGAGEREEGKERKLCWLRAKIRPSKILGGFGRAGGGKGGDKLLGINAFRIITSWLALCTDHPWC